MNNSYIKFLAQVTNEDLFEVGGKAASLGEMLNAGLPIPTGFVLTTKAYMKLHNQQFSKKIENEIFKAFKKIGAKKVAVRSSAVSEDSSGASWAGQLDSFLNVSKDKLLDSIKKCWDSIFSERARLYAVQQKIPKNKLAVAVVVQKMINSEKSGIAFSVHPVTQDKNQIIIEAVFGLGDEIVAGKVTPDSYILDKHPRKIIDKNIQNKQILTDNEILHLSDIILRIEEYDGFPCDIEWAFENGKFYIVQSRPITTITEKIIPPLSLAQSITRDWSVVFAEMWVTAYTKTFKEQFDWAYTDVVYEGDDSTITIYRSPKEHLETMRDIILKNLAIDPLWLDKQSDKLVSEVEKFKKWMRVFNSDLLSLDNNKILKAFKFFVSQNLAISPRYVMMLWFPIQMEQYNDKEKYNDVIKRAQIGRDKTHGIGQVIDTLARLFAAEAARRSGIPPDLAKYLTTSEIQSIFLGKRVKLKEVSARKKHFVISRNGIQNISAQEYCIMQKYILLQPPTDTYSQIKGAVAYNGLIRGKVKIVRNGESFSKIKKGDIIVSPITTPDYMIVLKKAAAIITDEGGITCHAAIIAREMKIPCITGTKIASKILKDGNVVEVDAYQGVVKILKS